MRRIIFYITSFILFISAVSCQDNDNYDGSPNEKFKSVTLTLSLPGDMRSSNTTKSMTEEEDQAVKTVDVLAFMDDGSGNYLYAYRSKGQSITVNNGTGSFKVTLSEYFRNQVFVILANASDEFDAAGITVGENISTALPKLQAKSTKEWDARDNGMGVLRYIPMYCKTPPVRITSATEILGGYNLVRMLARFDVRVKGSVTNFRLVKACIFNRKDRGYIAYTGDTWDKSLNILPDVDVVTTKVNTVSYNADASHQVIRSIYGFEAAAVTDRQDATAIVVGGYFDYPTNKTKITYYRIDIPQKTGFYNGDIIRNHLYEIEIQSVEDDGAISPEIAFDGEMKITATVEPWNLAKQEVIFDGEYSFVINFGGENDSKILSFMNTLSNKTITATTTHPSGILASPVKYEDNNNAGWLSVNETEAGKWKISLTSNNYKKQRYASLTLTAGNFEYVVPITQRGCGDNGVPELMVINTSTYSTYLYGNKCWMISNSGEGSDFKSKKFGTDAIGSIVGTTVGATPPSNVYQTYYAWDQANMANNACPNGWHLPTSEEFQAVIAEVTTNPNTIASQYWKLKDVNALAGQFNPVTAIWSEWGEFGYWWCASANASYVKGHSGGLNAVVNSPGDHGWYSVRCVKD